MKKSRRGLGRGLGALIQSTVPEDEVQESEAPTASESRDGDRIPPAAASAEPDQVDDVSPEEHDSAEDSLPSGDVAEMASVEADEADEADKAEKDTGADRQEVPEVRSPEASEDSVADRYLKGGVPAASPRPVPRDARRPVDLFFPDRRSEATAAAADIKKSVDSSSSSGARRRPSMPSVETRSLRTPKSAAENPRGAAVDQPIELDHAAEDSSTAPEEASAPLGPVSAPLFSGSIEGAELRAISVADIHPNPRQPREVFDEDDMEELVASIREVGVLQPIVVRPVDGPSPYELVMGERRWRASQRAGLATIPAIIRRTADTALLRDALLENLHRSQLNPLEEAAAYEQLLEDFDCTQDELSSRIGRSRPQISNTLRLLRLPPLVQRRVASGVLSAGHARALLGLVDPAEMEKLAQKIVSEGLSVRATEELVSLHDGIRQTTPKSRSARSERHERLDYLANSLTDQLDTTVKITLGARKGKIAIDFATVEDLNRIMTLISPTGSNDG